jgi:hypothetical protein
MPPPPLPPRKREAPANLLENAIKRNDVGAVTRQIELRPPQAQKEWLDVLELSRNIGTEVYEAIFDKLFGLKNEQMRRMVFVLDLQRSYEKRDRCPHIALELVRRDSLLEPTPSDSTLVLAALWKSTEVLMKLLEIIERKDQIRRRTLLTALVDEENGITVFNQLVANADEHHERAIRKFLEIEPSVGRLPSGFGERTPLHTAISDAMRFARERKPHLTIVKIIVEACPQALTVHDKKGKPPYRYAATAGEEPNEFQKDIKLYLEQAIFESFDSVSDIRAALYGIEGKLYNNYKRALRLTMIDTGILHLFQFFRFAQTNIPIQQTN